MTNTNIQNLLQMNDSDFLQALQNQFGYRLGRLLKTGKRHSYPLHLLKACETMQQHVILIGNAAHTLHPIAAQGLNLAFSEIAMLAQIIFATQTATGIRTHLEKISCLARKTNLRQHPAFTSITRPVHEDFVPLNLARQLGMIGLDICPPAKRRFARKAIGRTGNLPRLLLDKNL